MRTFKVMMGALLLVAPMGCLSPGTSQHATTSPALTEEDGRQMVRTEMLFGLAKPDGGEVDEIQWRQFVDQSIVTWFPAGFTEIDAEGHWRGTDGKVVVERSKVVILFHDGSEATLKKLDDLRRLYRQRFGQQAVIRASGQVWVSF